MRDARSAREEGGIKMKSQQEKLDAGILARKDLELAAAHFAAGAKRSRQHIALLRKCLKRYGDHGVSVSGIGRDHFPEKEKEKLRVLCRKINTCNTLGVACRPKGIRFSTIYALGRAVCRRDGTGFYGFSVSCLNLGARKEVVMYQPLTGAKCGCKCGVERDNCRRCEGTGMVVDHSAIRAATSNPKTKVIFRRQKERNALGEIAAVFPELTDRGFMTSYAHIGQHSLCSYHWYANCTEPVHDPRDYAELKAELERIGYSLDVRRRIQKGRASLI